MKNQENTSGILKGESGYDLALKDPEHWEARRFGESEWSPYSVWGEWCYKKCANKHTQWRCKLTQPMPSYAIVCSDSDLLKRYRICAVKIWDMFPTDPLGDSPTRFMCDRLEELIERGLIAPIPTQSPIELIREAKRDAWQEGYDRRDKREPGGTANNPYHENYQGLPIRSQVSLEAEIATLGAELQKERYKVRQYAMAIDAIDATASQFRNCTKKIKRARSGLVT
jgi:hypothetical protein